MRVFAWHYHATIPFDAVLRHGRGDVLMLSSGIAFPFSAYSFMVGASWDKWSCLMLSDSFLGHLASGLQIDMARSGLPCGTTFLFVARLVLLPSVL
jgi:hypothetical protein